MRGCKFHTYVENMVQKIPIAQPSTGAEEQAAVAAVIKSGMLAQGPGDQRYKKQMNAG